MTPTALKIASAIARGFNADIEYDKADIGAADCGMPMTPVFIISGIAAESSQTQVLHAYLLNIITFGSIS